MKNTNKITVDGKAYNHRSEGMFSCESEVGTFVRDGEKMRKLGKRELSEIRNVYACGI